MSGAVLPAGVQGAEPLLEAFRPPRSWSIIAFCVMVKAFSRILKCKNQGIMYNLMSLRLRKPPRLFQWDAVDTSPDLGGQNVPSQNF